MTGAAQLGEFGNEDPAVAPQAREHRRPGEGGGSHAVQQDPGLSRLRADGVDSQVDVAVPEAKSPGAQGAHGGGGAGGESSQPHLTQLNKGSGVSSPHSFLDA